MSDYEEGALVRIDPEWDTRGFVVTYYFDNEGVQNLRHVPIEEHGYIMIATTDTNHASNPRVHKSIASGHLSYWGGWSRGHGLEVIEE